VVGVLSLSAWEGRLVSGHRSGMLVLWNVAMGACEQVLESNPDRPIYASAVCGSRLASGSAEYVKVWAKDAANRWACERTLRGHAGWIFALTEWQGKLLSGSADRSVRVWDAATGARDATLSGHGGAVYALAAHGDRLFSASRDGTIRVWAWGTWAALRTVEPYGGATGQYPRCLAVSGSQLVCGSAGSLGDVRVWGLENLDLQHTLPKSSASIRALMAVEGGLWAGVGRDVMVWGSGA
jgi:WD40 repeat protein